MTRQACVLALAIALAGCAGPSLAGRWTNRDRLVQAAPGDVVLVLREDGRGEVLFDESRYEWPATSFTWRRGKDRVRVLWSVDGRPVEELDDYVVRALTDSELVVKNESFGRLVFDRIPEGEDGGGRSER